MNTLLTIIELLLTLPWWASCLLVGAIVAFLAGVGVWFHWKISSITTEALAEVAAPLIDAQLTIHSIKPADRPTTVSSFDLDDDDQDDEFPSADERHPADDYIEAWQSAGDFFWIDATITPKNPAAMWYASVLTLVPANWKGSVGALCESAGPLHSVELFAGGAFRPLSDGEDVLTGQRRVRLLMASPPGHSHVKFAYYSATFGDFQLPAPLAVGAR
jgi:hypothetical protein